MTALAAEPEMGIVVFILGDMRYGMGGEFENLTIDEADLRWKTDEGSFMPQTNWTSLVARAVDEVGGHGFVTEYAGSTDEYVRLLMDSMPSDPDQIEATEALLALMGGSPYLTRLYTRLSAEEMTEDPVFKRTGGGDVNSLHTLPRYEGDEEICSGELSPWTDPDAYADAFDPCDFTTCGAGGSCFHVEGEGGVRAAGCACVPGATAWTTFDPSGAPTVICQDQRMSFLNPGDVEIPGATPLPDACVGFDCGAGTCIAMNMTPTCICHSGMVAVGSVSEDGTRLTNCTSPIEEIPRSFYLERLPAVAFPGRVVDVPDATSTQDGGFCAVGTSSSTTLPAVLALAGLLLASRRRR
jgi:hypothetical protein